MFFAAHADDTSACMGGTASLLAQMGASIRSIICMPANRNTVARQTRVEEAIAEHEALGLPRPECLEFFNGELEVNPKTRERFALMISGWGPDVVFTHFPSDDHPDHQIVGCLATKPGLDRGVTWETFCFEAWRSETEPQSAGFRPSHIVDISGESADKKYRAIDAHTSQNAVYLARLGENISAFYGKIDRRHGQQIGVRSSERFLRLTRPVDKSLHSGLEGLIKPLD